LSWPGSRLHECVDRRDEVAHGPHRAEVVCRDLAPGLAPQPVEQIDRVDAVDLEVLVEARFRCYAPGLYLEQLDLRRLDLG